MSVFKKCEQIVVDCNELAIALIRLDEHMQARAVIECAEDLARVLTGIEDYADGGAI